MASLIQCKTMENFKKQKDPLHSIKEDEISKQLLFLGQSKETTTPNFVRLFVMRLVYGIASTMGLEDRLSSFFNGALVPPNADDDDYFGFGDAEDFFDDD